MVFGGDDRHDLRVGCADLLGRCLTCTIRTLLAAVAVHFSRNKSFAKFASTSLLAAAVWWSLRQPIFGTPQYTSWIDEFIDCFLLIGLPAIYGVMIAVFFDWCYIILKMHLKS
jgi:hypothetical protein